MSEDKLSQMVSRADKDSTGYISEHNFVEAFDWLMLQGQDERDYMAIFNMLVGSKFRARKKGLRSVRSSFCRHVFSLNVLSKRCLDIGTSNLYLGKTHYITPG